MSKSIEIVDASVRAGLGKLERSIEDIQHTDRDVAMGIKLAH